MSWHSRDSFLPSELTFLPLAPQLGARVDRVRFFINLAKTRSGTDTRDLSVTFLHPSLILQRQPSEPELRPRPLPMLNLDSLNRSSSHSRPLRPPERVSTAPNQRLPSHLAPQTAQPPSARRFRPSPSAVPHLRVVERPVTHPTTHPGSAPRLPPATRPVALTSKTSRLRSTRRPSRPTWAHWAGLSFSIWLSLLSRCPRSRSRATCSCGIFPPELAWEI